MGLKILWQSILPKNIPEITKKANILWEGLEKHAKQISSPENKIVLEHLEKSLKDVTTSYVAMVNNIFLIEKIKKAEKKGYDAVVVGCNGDSGVKEARCAVNIPVIGLTESSIMLAKMLGFKSAIVTIRNTWVQPIESKIYLYGERDAFIDYKPVRYFDMKYDELISCYSNNERSIIEKFEKVAKSCIEDGADVIINGCAFTGPAFSLLGYTQVSDSGVPIIDSTAVGIKFAESLADLNKKFGIAKSHSKTSIYRTPEKEKLIEINKLFNNKA